MTKHGRLIDAEWLKESIHNFFTGKIHPVTEDDIMAYIDAAPTIETKLSAQPEQRWIPVSERLPKKSDKILITHRGGVSYGWYNGIYFERGAGAKHSPIKTVVAWMPLPEPYKVEQDEQSI